MRLFDRKITVLVGPKGLPGYSWTQDLKISFSCDKDGKKKPNKATVQIWNLSEVSRSFCEMDDNICVVSAGYGVASSVIFYGDVVGVSHKLDGRDICTELEVGDGERAYQLSFINNTYGVGTPVAIVALDVVRQMGLAIGNIAVLPPTVFNQGYVASGLARDVMDDLMGAVGHSWSIQDGMVQIVQKDLGTVEPALVVSPETGLLGSPEKVKAEGKKQKRGGIRFKCLLSPWIKPKKYVMVKSALLTGFCIVQTVRHSGDSMGGDFCTEVEATSVGPVGAGFDTQDLPVDESIEALAEDQVAWLQREGQNAG